MNDYYGFVSYPRKSPPVKRKPKRKAVSPRDKSLSPYALGQQAAGTDATNPFDTNSSAGEAWQAGYDGE